MILPCPESKASIIYLIVNYYWTVLFYLMRCLSDRFEIAIFVMIFMNMVVMAFEHYGQRQIFVHILAGFNSFFTTIYALGRLDFKPDDIS